MIDKIMTADKLGCVFEVKISNCTYALSVVVFIFVQCTDSMNFMAIGSDFEIDEEDIRIRHLIYPINIIARTSSTRTSANNKSFFEEIT